MIVDMIASLLITINFCGGIKGPIQPPGPDNPPIFSIPDQSTSFYDAVEIDFNNSCIEDFQTDSDIDYYYFHPLVTNYVKFQINGFRNSYDVVITVYESTHQYVLHNYSFDTSITTNVVPYIYVEKNSDIYIKVEKNDFVPGGVMSIPDEIESTVLPYYETVLYTANDVTGDIEDYVHTESYYNFNNSNVRYVYFDSSSYGTLNEMRPTNDQKTVKEFILEAMSIWNDVGEIQFVETSDSVNFDIWVEMINYETNPAATGIFSFINHNYNFGRITSRVQLNKYYLNNSSSGNCLKTSLHELGHSLGLKHIDYDGINNVMYSSNFFYTRLGKADIGAYRYLWN